jgi:hypothetical protein
MKLENRLFSYAASYLMSFRDSFTGIKRWERESNYLPSKADFKNEWMFTSNPQYNFMMCRGTALFYFITGHENAAISKNTTILLA